MGSPQNRRQTSIIVTQERYVTAPGCAFAAAACRPRAVSVSLLQSLSEPACQTTTPSSRVIFKTFFPLPFVVGGGGFFPRTGGTSLMRRERPQSLPSAAVLPKSGARWPSNLRNSPSHTLRNFILCRRKNSRPGFSRSRRQIFERVAAFILRLVARKQPKRLSSLSANIILKKGNPLVTAFFLGTRGITAV